MSSNSHNNLSRMDTETRNAEIETCVEHTLLAVARAAGHWDELGAKEREGLR